MGFIMNDEFVEELLDQLPGWVALQDIEEKDDALRDLEIMVQRGIKLSDAPQFCAMMHSPDNIASMYGRFLEYAYSLHADEDDGTSELPTQRSQLAQEILDKLAMLNARLDRIEEALRR